MSSTSTLTLRPVASTWSRPAGADVVGPAVPADDPDAAPDQVIDHAAQVGDVPVVLVQGLEPPLQLGDPVALGAPAPTRVSCGAPRIVVRQVGADRRRAAPSSRASGQLGVPVRGQPESEAELGVVLEQGVRPGRAAPVGVGRPRRGGQVPAVDRGAAGGVGDHQPVAEQLRQELDVRRLAAARAGAGELEERLQELRAAHGAEVHPGRGRPTGSVSKNAMLSRSAATSGSRGREVDRLAFGVVGRPDRAGLDAQLAAGAVLHVDLQREAGVREPAGVQRRRLEIRRRLLQQGLVVVGGPDDAVRADEAAVAALDAQVRIPFRDQFGDVALLVRRGAARVGAVHRQRADRQLVAAAGHHHRGDGADELRRAGRHHRGQLPGRTSPGRAPRSGAALRAWRRRRRGSARPPRRRAGRRSWRSPP